MLNVINAVLLSASVACLSMAYSAPESLRHLDPVELSRIDGGQIYYCSAVTDNPNNKGCQECKLVAANWKYYNSNGGIETVNIYKKCTNNSLDEVCQDDNYTGMIPFCTKTGNLSCGAGVNASSDNNCSQGVPTGWTQQTANGQIPTYPTIQCNTTYSSATNGQTFGVNCSGITPGTLH